MYYSIYDISDVGLLFGEERVTIPDISSDLSKEDAEDYAEQVSDHYRFKAVYKRVKL